jgi:hypothetical protein
MNDDGYLKMFLRRFSFGSGVFSPKGDAYSESSTNTSKQLPLLSTIALENQRSYLSVYLSNDDDDDDDDRSFSMNRVLHQSHHIESTILLTLGGQPCSSSSDNSVLFLILTTTHLVMISGCRQRKKNHQAQIPAGRRKPTSLIEKNGLQAYQQQRKGQQETG